MYEREVKTFAEIGDEGEVSWKAGKGRGFGLIVVGKARAS